MPLLSPVPTLWLLGGLAADPATTKAVGTKESPAITDLRAVVASTRPGEVEALSCALQGLDLRVTSLSTPQGTEVRQAVETALRQAASSSLVVVALSTPSGIDLEWLQDEVDRSPAASVLLFLPTLPLDEASRARAGAIQAMGEHILVVMGAGLGADSRQCQGLSRGACALTAGLRADGDHDLRLEAGELEAALKARVAADGGRAQDVLALHALPPTWFIPLKKKTAAPAAPALSPVPLSTRQVPVKLCLQANGTDVPASYSFRTDDTLTLSVTVPNSGYLSLASMGPTGSLYTLFPAPGQHEDNRVRGGSTLWLPPPDAKVPLTFREPVGKERLALIWSETPIPKEEVEAIMRAHALNREGGAPIKSIARDKGRKDIVLGEPGVEADRVTGAPCSVLSASGNLDLWVLALTLDHVPK